MSSRYLIGIDLGTTNTVLAYTDTGGPADAPIEILPVPQLVAHGEVRTLPSLPSFLYFPTAEELSAGVVSATWDEDPPMATGLLARDQGALVPSRQVSSAKSWLASASADRRAKILPPQPDGSPAWISPTEAAARYLMHLRDAWNGAAVRDEESRFQNQDVVLTVPASFDEEARELTVEAARRGGIQRLTLLEEPLAAFYAWIVGAPNARRGAPHASSQVRELNDGDIVLICDIGGGTTDFSLLRAQVKDGELQFERTAVGEHLLLGGDNLDLALMHHLQRKLNGAPLTLRQRQALRRSCSAAKEELLSNLSLASVPVTVLGSGPSIVGQTLSVELTRKEIENILIEAFLPITSPDELPQAQTSAGLRELGLPYASDPAITKHLAAFLTQAACAASNRSDRRLRFGSMVRPDVVLFNGGFCTPEIVRKRIVDAVAAWFGDGAWRPKVLNNADVNSAVARGAAYYGRVRRGQGSRVRAASPRSYYIGLGTDPLEAVCVLPAGVDEGVTLPPLKREFSVVANRPISFSLYSSLLRHDSHGDVVQLDAESVHHHAPLSTFLRYGKRLRDVNLNVQLRAGLTEVGTLELWCESRDTEHRWRLQFELRGKLATETTRQALAAPQSVATAESASIAAATDLIREVFADPVSAPAKADSLIGEMETALELRRDAWPVDLLRQFCRVLIENAQGRKRSPRHEFRWNHLCGFCLRPGFGTPHDSALVQQVRRVLGDAPVFADDLQCQVARIALLRRIAGGINASEQHRIYKQYSAILQVGRNANPKKRRLNRQLESEAWRLVANLEHLPATTRSALGRELVAKLRKDSDDAIWLSSLARLGARVPLYGSLQCVVPARVAEEWIDALLAQDRAITAPLASAIVQIARRTDDAARDLSLAVRKRAIATLREAGVAEDTIDALSNHVPPDRGDAARSFGESLAPGLNVIYSSSCLLTVPAFESREQHVS